jgi:murein DD-endopeptidase MepM/ murein hydrolase activator NlpD
MALSAVDRAAMAQAAQEIETKAQVARNTWMAARAPPPNGRPPRPCRRPHTPTSEGVVSSRKERDRYRGRRRIPTPPRSRYTAVATTALIGAGVVAMATAAAMPDMKDSGSLAGLNGNSISSPRLTLDRANRSNDRSATDASNSSPTWLLPLASYTFTTSPYGEQPSAGQKGFDLLAPEGTPFYAAAKGTVTLARWHGGYGYTVIVDLGNGLQIVYAHASKLLVPGPAGECRRPPRADRQHRLLVHAALAR